MKNSKVIASLALGSIITISGCASNPFVAESMHSGHHDADKSMEGNCATGQMDRHAEGSCGGTTDMTKDMEGKCGEGKCGS